MRRPRGPGSPAFAEFYATARDDCLRTVWAVTQDADLAEDLVAEAFARAWAAWPKVSHHDATRAWVVRTALNLNVSRWRRVRREVFLAAEHGLGEHGAVDPPPSGGALMNALGGLPERQLQVVALRIFLDLDTAATARVLRIAPGTVTAHLSRAITTLRDRLADLDRQEI
jgi:RNA polymerase sigma-70 factor (ECF subfamily)